MKTGLVGLTKPLHEVCGWSVWWDTHIPACKTFDAIMDTELDEARCMGVLLSEASIKSRWMKAAAGEGLDRGILVAVSIDNATIPLVFIRIQTEDFNAWQGHTNDEVYPKVIG